MPTFLFGHMSRGNGLGIPGNVPQPVADRLREIISPILWTLGLELVDVVWGKDLSTYYIQTPPRFTKAYDQYGAVLTPIGPYLPVSFGAIYIHHSR